MNEEIKKVSIITVCFNAVQSIRITVESVLKQKPTADIEYIVIDGGSDDGTLEILNEYINDISCLVTEEDEGIYDAMNKGLKCATGDIVGFLNAGDEYVDDAIETIVHLFRKEDIDVLYGDAVYVHEGYSNRIRKGDPHVEHILFSMIACHQAVFIRTKLHKMHEFNTSYSIAADREVLARIYLQGSHFRYLEKPLARYDDSGISSREVYKTSMEQSRLTYHLLSDSVIFKDRMDALKKDVILRSFWNDWDNRISLMSFKNYFFSVTTPRLRFMIWGAGKYGEKAYQLMSELGYTMCGYIDANRSIKNKNTYEVTHPEDAQITDDCFLLIASKRYNEEIIEGIQSLSNMKTAVYYVFVDLLIGYEKSIGKTIESILSGV